MPPTLAILGAGQLGRMLALAAARLGIRCRFLDPAAAGPEPCACQGLGELIAADFTDRAALDRLAHGVDAITYEFENVPADSVEHLAKRLPVSPPPLALRTSQDRLLEKQAFAACAIPTNATAPWDPASHSLDDLRAILNRLGLPAVLKTRRLGYDGKGQCIIRDVADLPRLLASLPRAPLLAEAFVPFTRELSIIAARARDGQVRCYPLVQNTHADGILRRTVAPAPGIPQHRATDVRGSGSTSVPPTPGLQEQAEAHITTLMHRLDYVGVMALELFEVPTPAGPTLLANEIAPRVHNTGHWTIEAARTSQFENHIRAVMGLPLGDTSPVGHSIMINLIGLQPDPAKVLAIPGTTLHWYAKPVRPGRKVGHITIWADTPEEASDRADAVGALL